MSFIKFVEEDGTTNHKKVVDESRKLAFELVYGDDNYLRMTMPDERFVDFLMNNQGGDITIVLPSQEDKLIPIIKEAILALGLREPFFM